MSIITSCRFGAFAPSAALSFTIVAITASLHPMGFASAQEAPPAGEPAVVELPEVSVEQPSASAAPRKKKRAGNLKVELKTPPGTVLAEGISEAPAASGDATGSGQGAGSGAATGQGAASTSGNPPSFEVQEYRFQRRPGAESVVSVTAQDPGPRGNIREVLNETPGVFIPPRTAGSEGLISMRGSDISASGPRTGRGIRVYVDNVSFGRTDAGLTNAFFDPLIAEYIEVYRGASSLRFGALATGGALNIVSKTGLTSPGTTVGVTGGSQGFLQSYIETGGQKDAFDWFAQVSKFDYEGFQDHTDEDNLRFNGNIGWRPTKDFETRTYLSLGDTNLDLARTVPLNRLEQLQKDAGALNLKADTDRNFDYLRLANKSVLRTEDTSYELGIYHLHTTLDHLPTPFAGIVDHTWRDWGASLRVEHKTEIAGLPTEIVAGVRINYTDGDFLRFQWTNGGKSKGTKILDWDFESWLLEGYGEAAVEIFPKFRLFTGLQWAYTTRDLNDRYTGGAVAAVNNPGLPNGPQPGRSVGLQEYGETFDTLNPKVGVNWEHNKGHFLFGSIAKSFEAPTSGDLGDILAFESRPGSPNLPDLKAQDAWTREIGIRGAFDRFQYDITLYNMTIDNELLTRCVAAVCTEVVAFNASKTIHNGIEIGMKAIPVKGMLTSDDHIYASGVWNINDFRFDKDPVFGSGQLPVIPRHQVYAELGYRHPSGFFMLGNLIHLSERNTTFDSSGGEAFVVPDVTLYGAKVGFEMPDESWSVFLEGRNLADEIYAADFAANASVPRGAFPPFAAATSPEVRPGDGRAFYAGMAVKF